MEMKNFHNLFCPSFFDMGNEYCFFFVALIPSRKLVHRFQITCIFLYHNSAGDLIYFFNFILPLKYHRFFIE